MNQQESWSTARSSRRFGSVSLALVLLVGLAVSRPAPADAGAGTDIVILGGTSAVSASVEAQLRNCTTGTVTRLSGADRYQTATAVSRFAFTSSKGAFVATGSNFPDALAAGAAAGRVDQPVLLVGNAVPGTTADEIRRLGVSSITISGGAASVSTNVEASLNGLAPTTRVSGPDRYATAAAIAAEKFATAKVVYISTGSNFPDALAGVPAAIQDGAPILLVSANVIPQPTAVQLNRLKPSTIKVLGGEAVISAKVAADLAGYASNVVRLAGTNRYSTAAAISRDAFSGGASTIYIATGDNYPDALAGGPAAGSEGAPILLVQKNAIPSPTREEITRITGAPCAPPLSDGSPTVSFTIAGDMGARSAATATLGLIADLAPDANFVVGDLSYNDATPESKWCSYVQNIVGTTLPFELLTGNHEDDGGANGFIRKFTSCLPDRLSVVGDYGVQYYKDLGTPVRIIGIAPDLDVNGVPYTYRPGTPERKWLESAVSGARAQGRWVVILQHKPCINAAEKSCAIGEELADWQAANADIIVMGHSHTYERSHQLSCVDAGTTTQACIADKDGKHKQGDGAVFVINGLGGRDRPVNRNDSEAGYFASLMGSGDAQSGHGVVRIIATKTTITGTFIGSDTPFTDTFTISR